MTDDRVRYFDDFKPGDRLQSAPLEATEALIVEFARFYDPQIFHTDPRAAQETIYEGLIASGLQTIALTFKLFIETGALSASSLGSPGLDEIRWKVPVRPARGRRGAGSTSVEFEVGSGIVRIRYTTVNQRGEAVLTFIGNQLLRRR
jgi:acyl dehydratase